MRTSPHPPSPFGTTSLLSLRESCPLPAYAKASAGKRPREATEARAYAERHAHARFSHFGDLYLGGGTFLVWVLVFTSIMEHSQSPKVVL